ncbi:hypothetical protein [Pseudomonas akapageensis]|uniref:hypothetical protein n=1 Tax=Pseudomonas akapageensis TaxID=2609961 RepID=UPI001FEBCDFA|nr:hypothetical protein [Pseudomonas akapageensis]
MTFSLYLSRYHLDTILEALKNSRQIVFWGVILRHQSWVGRSLLLSMIAGWVVWPGLGIRKGEIDPVDIDNFPPHLKRLLMIYLVMTLGAGLWLVIVYVLMELT